jgi:hypothetical protein
MEQFPPLLLHLFGEEWFETGILSCYFRHATVGDEAVRVLASTTAPARAAAHVDVWMETDDGTRVLDATASIGSPAEPSLLRRKLVEPRDAGELRILDQLAPGQVIQTVPTRLTDADAKPRLAAITEPLDWYAGESPWGGAIVNPGLLVHLMVAAQPAPRAGSRAVGLYGAIEVRHIAGPVFADRSYEVGGQVLAVGTTPKTEYVWFETVLREPGRARDVASMLMMLRFMKASSPLWQ